MKEEVIESIFGCLERIEEKLDKQPVQTEQGKSEDNRNLSETITPLVDSMNRTNRNLCVLWDALKIVSERQKEGRKEVLEAIGRRHTAQDIREALEKVRTVGGFTVNMDLIAGLPQDDPKGFAQSLREVLALKPENITVHTLSLKRGSRLMAERGRIPPAEEVTVMLKEAYAALEREGYSPYYLYRQKNMSGGFENVGWTLPGHENLYNICIMEELCSILAMGAGGSTKLIRRDGGKNLRLVAPKYPTEYIEAIDRICRDKEAIGSFCRDQSTAKKGASPNG